MPHVIVKLWPGKPEKTKHQLSDAIVNDVTRILGYGEDSVSVALEEIEPKAWAEAVYRQDILAHPDRLYKRPGYTL